MATHKGVDVSQHNGNVDARKLKASGINFVMIRSSYGDIMSYPRQIDKSSSVIMQTQRPQDLT